MFPEIACSLAHSSHIGLGNMFVFLMLEVHTGGDLPELSGLMV